MAKHPAAFINVIAEDGSKEQAVRHLQQTWDELVDAKARLAEAEALLREGCGYIDDVPDRRSAYKDRVRAFLAPDSASGCRGEPMQNLWRGLGG